MIESFHAKDPSKVHAMLNRIIENKDGGITAEELVRALTGTSLAQLKKKKSINLSMVN